jgi:hypothetical protein
MAYHPVYLATALRKHISNMYILFTCSFFNVQNAETYKSISVDIVVSEPKDDEIGTSCSTHGENRNAQRIFGVKPEGKTPLGRPRHRWEDNIHN